MGRITDNITDKQKRFCEEYLIDFNGTQAAIRAGYSQKTAVEQASRLLINVKVQEYIRQKQNKVANKLEITQERVLQEYARIAFSDVTSLFNESGGFKKFSELTEDQKAVLSSLEVDEIVVSGQAIGTTKKVKVWDKKGALDSICKLLGYNAAIKQDLTTKGESLNDATIEKQRFDELLKAAREGIGKNTGK